MQADIFGNTALDVALEHGHLDVLRQLVAFAGPHVQETTNIFGGNVLVCTLPKWACAAIVLYVHSAVCMYCIYLYCRNGHVQPWTCARRPAHTHTYIHRTGVNEVGGWRSRMRW